MSCTTPASSAVSEPTSSRGSALRGSARTSGAIAAAGSLQPQPAPCDSEVSGTGKGVAATARILRGPVARPEPARRVRRGTGERVRAISEPPRGGQTAPGHTCAFPFWRTRVPGTVTGASSPTKDNSICSDVLAGSLRSPPLPVPRSSSASPPPAPTPPTAALRRSHSLATGLKRSLDRLIASGAPGSVVLVREHGRTTRLAAGYADTRTKRRMRPSDRFRIGSVTKTFVATAILQLAGEGKLSLDDSVERWLPGEVPNGGAITVRQLLTMTSARSAAKGSLSRRGGQTSPVAGAGSV